MDAVLLAQIRNSSAFNQMLAKNRYLLLRAKKTSVNIVHRGLFFQASSSLASAHDFPIPSEAGHARPVYDESERKWTERKRQVWETTSNKAKAIERAEFIERDYCQAEQEDLAERIEQQREQVRTARETPSMKSVTLFDLARAAQEWELGEFLVRSTRIH